MAEISNAIRKWRDVLGAANVIDDPAVLQQLTRNVGGMTREIPAILYPANTEDVRRVIQVANECEAPVYPISTGRNWGLGSRLPVRGGCVVVDLSRMNSIRYVDERHGYAVIEPGVTQWQLHEYLEERKLPFMLDSTGAGRDTSIIGNTLERGVALHSSRAERLCGLEVVLGTGEVIKTGFGHYPSARAEYLYPYGVGPDLTGLFVQSNLGVVTSAGIRLMPKKDRHAVMIISMDDLHSFEEFIDVLANLRRREIIQNGAHIYNRKRTEISLAPLVYRYAEANMKIDHEVDRKKFVEKAIEKADLGVWSAYAGLMGTSEQISAAKNEIERAMHGIAKVQFTDDTQLKQMRRITTIDDKLTALLVALEPIYGLLTRGIPTDAALASVHWPVGILPASDSVNPDDTDSGLLYYLPSIPMTGHIVAEVVEETERVFGKYGFIPYITMNMVTTAAFEGVINLAFDRRDDDTLRDARRCIDELAAGLMGRGIFPYRVDIDSMSIIVKEDDPFWRLIRDIKRVTDPKGIIAPGRYDLV